MNEQYVYQRCKNTPKSTLAEEEWLHQDTVKEIFNRQAKQAEVRHQQPQVRILGIDEIALKKRHKQYVLVISDLERHCVIAVLPDRKKALLEKWFDDLTVEEREAIRVVSMDMWAPYRLEEFRTICEKIHDRAQAMRLTNGFVEGLNRAIRNIINRACGYHVFENFRLQVMAEHGKLDTDSPLI